MLSVLTSLIGTLALKAYEANYGYGPKRQKKLTVFQVYINGCFRCIYAAKPSRYSLLF